MIALTESRGGGGGQFRTDYELSGCINKVNLTHISS
jgi:hypothetical protein